MSECDIWDSVDSDYIYESTNEGLNGVGKSHAVL
jgi:hypothetical protein